MAVEAPDPKMFASWEEAFEFPVPTVRAMEKQLRRDVDSNREKLRTLVGSDPTFGPLLFYEAVGRWHWLTCCAFV